MSAKATPLITPASGGRLITSESQDTVGALHYVEKVNFRRDGDVEARREGWVKFRANAELPQGTQHLDLSDKVTLLAENVRPNGDRCVIAATATTIYRYNLNTGTWSVIGSGFSALGRRWQTATIDGYIVFNNAVDLPQSYRVEDSSVTPIKELREVGIASAGWVTEYNGFLVCLNIVEVKAAELAGVMNSGQPYGLVTASLCNHVPYKVIWSEFGKPTNWSPVFEVTMGASSATIPMPFQSSVFVPGVTRVAVVNGGPNGNTLGGDSAHPEGILVTGVSTSTITLEIPTTAGLTYPRQVQVMRWTDISAISGSKDLQGDASHIICGKELNGLLMIYRTRGIYVGRYTAVVEAPFEFRERAETTNVPIWPEAVATINGEVHVYPGKGGVFYQFDGVSIPSEHHVLNDCSRTFFAGLSPASDVFVVDNPIAKEAWFARPGFTLCYDYVGRGTLSITDAEITAAAYVNKPGSTDEWFILCIAGKVYTYGRINDVVTTWLRDGANPGGRLKWGKNAFGDTYNEKTVDSYLMQYASDQQAVPMRLRIFSGHSASSAMETLLDEVILQPTEDGGVIPLHFLATYFQDEISISTAGAPVDSDVRYIGRLMTRGVVGSRGVARNDA